MPVFRTSILSTQLDSALVELADQVAEDDRAVPRLRCSRSGPFAIQLIHGFREVDSLCNASSVATLKQ
jgi:hypothetical protein